MSDSDTINTAAEGSYRMPRFQHARVSDVMRTGILSCPPSASVREVARTMASHHIHSVVVREAGEAGTWSLLSDLDLVAAARRGDVEDLSAADAAAGEPVTVGADDALERAAQLMIERNAAHAVVVDPTGQPLGMLSSLDIAGTLAWGLA
jgi:CBS domain-containing protein